MARRSLTLRATAIHESGHVSCAWHYGIPIAHASIVPEDSALGHVQIAPGREKGPPSGRTFFEHMAVIYFAGGAAQRIYNPRSGLKQACRKDHEEAARLAGVLCLSPDTERAWLRCGALMARDIVQARWSVVEALASALEALRVIPGDEAFRICDEAAARNDAAHTTSPPERIPSDLELEAYVAARRARRAQRRDVDAAISRAWIDRAATGEGSPGEVKSILIAAAESMTGAFKHEDFAARLEAMIAERQQLACRGWRPVVDTMKETT
ncbi:MAG: hypothetical protein Q8M31_08820 [Beijerinckiaceae bacterium]|nr:hypothetical protein [Beijerinckiaceae bacterium]